MIRFPCIIQSLKESVLYRIYNKNDNIKQNLTLSQYFSEPFSQHAGSKIGILLKKNALCQIILYSKVELHQFIS